MKRILPLIFCVFCIYNVNAQWIPFASDDGAVLSNGIGNKHLVIENKDDLGPVKLYLSGEYTSGLQIGRDDMAHKISLLTGQVLVTNANRHLVMENDNASQPVKLYLSGDYSRGLQLGRDDMAHKISLLTGQVLFTNANRHLVMENSNASEPVKLYLSGDYSRGLQLGRDDMAHKISLFTGQVLFTNGNRHLVMENDNELEPVKLYLSGNYSNGLQIGRDDKKQKINLNGNVAVAGKLEATEIKVSSSPTADFVFEENYPLRDLDEVELFINEHQHLPDIPSAKKIEANGIDLAEMNTKLLQKIEELTLYTIAQQKEIEKLKAKVNGIE
jgi:heat shock protein HspQ